MAVTSKKFETKFLAPEQDFAISCFIDNKSVRLTEKHQVVFRPHGNKLVPVLLLDGKEAGDDVKLIVRIGSL